MQLMCQKSQKAGKHRRNGKVLLSSELV